MSGPVFSATEGILAARRKHDRAPLPVRNSGQEGRALKAEVARLRASRQREDKEKETLMHKIEKLKAELKATLRENRSLGKALEEKRSAQRMAEENARRTHTLDNARELFKSMLEGGVGEQPRLRTDSPSRACVEDALSVPNGSERRITGTSSLSKRRYSTLSSRGRQLSETSARRR
mmetsp:Transcript_834/g.2378  ORF Transcript_834/g.2378 Transcript_834/m.2378 type:complete len:177 (-) Transcript_834:891-1421(-)